MRQARDEAEAGGDQATEATALDLLTRLMHFRLLHPVLDAAGVLGQVGEDAAAVGPYTVVTDLAHKLVDALGRGETGAFTSTFSALESQLASASPESRELLVVGLLEDLQTLSLNEGLSLDAWAQWLGPRTLEGWEVMKAYWDGGLARDGLSAFIASGVLPRQ